MKSASIWMAGIAAMSLPASERVHARTGEPAETGKPAAVEFVNEEHRALDEEYRTGLAACEEKYREELSKLDTSYMSALETLLDTLTKLKVIAAMEIVKLEIARIDMGAVERSDVFSSAPDKVKEMRDIYEAARAKLDKRNLNRLIGVWLRYDRGLEEIEKALTMNNRIEKALAVRRIRTGLKNPAEKAEEPVRVAVTPVAPPDGSDPRPWKKPPGDPEGEPPATPGLPDPATLKSADLPELKPLGTSELAAARSELGPKPQRTSAGYPLLMRSLRNGKVGEIDPAKIVRWGSVSAQTFGNEKYWAVDLVFTANTLFGSQECGGTALVRNGKIVKWIYTVSGRPIR